MSASRVIVVLALCIALLLLVQGIIGLAAPDLFAGMVRFMQTSPAIYVAAAVRVAVGVVLLQAAYTSRLPIFLRIFGGFVLLGGLLTPFVGRQFAEVHSWLVVHERFCFGASFRNSLVGAYSCHCICGRYETTKPLTNRSSQPASGGPCTEKLRVER